MEKATVKMAMALIMSIAALVSVACPAHADEGLSLPPGQIVWKAAEGLPEGFFIGMLRVNPKTQGRSVAVMFPKRGQLPRHWHTVGERVVVLKGKIRLTDGDGKVTTLGWGGYAYTPGKMIHVTSCVTRRGCVVYSSTDGPFDLVRVDERGRPNAAPSAGERVRLPFHQMRWKTMAGQSDMTVSMLREDPETKGVEMLVAVEDGSITPCHRHTASETVLVLKGALRVMAAEGAVTTVERGGFLYLPGQAVHMVACEGRDGCVAYTLTDGPYDMVRVDAQGNPVTAP